jgi:hypothetical protein
MTSDQVISTDLTNPPQVRVLANDYSYTGWLVGIVYKRRGEYRAVVEDSNGRLFIHNPLQLTLVEKRKR